MNYSDLSPEDKKKYQLVCLANYAANSDWGLIPFLNLVKEVKGENSPDYNRRAVSGVVQKTLEGQVVTPSMKVVGRYLGHRYNKLGDWLSANLCVSDIQLLTTPGTMDNLQTKIDDMTGGQGATLVACLDDLPLDMAIGFIHENIH